MSDTKELKEKELEKINGGASYQEELPENFPEGGKYTWYQKTFYCPVCKQNVNGYVHTYRNTLAHSIIMFDNQYWYKCEQSGSVHYVCSETTL
ncbi:MAG: hypothetical protein Q4E33_05230 [Erysipelotrichaceae bacterium]|nr:hypothetical protein [Erysipelotrichaceae bacterium]